MTEPPRRRPPTEEERLKVIARRGVGGSDSGGTRFYRRVPEVSGGGIAVPPEPVGRAVLVAELCPTTPDTNQEVTTPVVDYREGAYFEAAASGSFRVDASGYFSVRLREVTTGYQVSYCQLVTFNDSNYHYMQNDDPQPVDAYELYFGDPTPYAGVGVGSAIVDYAPNPGYAVQFTDSGVYHFRVTLHIDVTS